VTAEIVVLRFPPRLAAGGVRLFRIGIESLSAQGCRGFVCDLDQPMRARRDQRAERVASTGWVPQLVWEIPFRRAVLLHGEEFSTKLPVPLRPDNFETEELAVAELRSRLSKSANNSA